MARRALWPLSLLAALAARPCCAAAGPPRPRFVYAGDARFAPFDYLGPDGRPTGFNVELVRELARDAGVEIEIRLGAWDAARAGLDDGSVDFVSLSYSEDRARAYAWLAQTWTMHQCVLFLPGRPSYPHEPADLARETIAVQERSAVGELLFAQPPPRATLVTVASQDAAVRLLKAGRASGAAGNSLTLRTAAADMRLYELVEMPLQAVPYGFMARRSRAADLEWVARGMLRLRGQGTVAALAERYLSVPAPSRTWRDYGVALGLALAATCALGLLAAAWNLSLRRQVARRTGELQATLVEKEALSRSLGASEKKYRDIVDLSPIGIWQALRDGTIVTANAAFAEILGYADAQEVIGLDMARDVFADPAERERLIARYAEAGRVTKLEVRMRRKDGTPIWVEGASYAVKNASGAIVQIESFLQDISARRAAEDALRASEERYRLLFDGNPLPMLVYDLDSLRFLAVNDAAVRLYGYERAELLRLTVADLAPHDETFERFLATRYDPRPAVLHVGRRRQIRKDRALVDIELTSLAIGFEGRAARMMVARDITDLLALQESVRRSETMSAMGALVAGVAHEVRNPLFSISATIDALEGELSGHTEHSEYMTLLRSQVARLTQLMRDLLDYGKPQALVRTPVAAPDLVRRAVRVCAGLARERGVSVEEEVAAELPPLDVDAGRMEQVVQNLVANGIEHSKRGGSVKVVARLDAARQALELRVEDEGSGIAAADLARVFEPFYSRRKGGTGLGLSIVERIVEAHGGRVSAANGAVRGSVFVVHIPLDSRAEAARA